jgi:mevalonate pyrophosphate decarboxylase
LADRQISYCVVVAEEQARETDSNDFLPDMGFLPASSAAAEAAVALAARQEAEEAERRLHPMFRSRSASESRSRSASAVVEEQPRKKRRVNGGMKKVEEDVIELLSDSDEEAVLNNAKYSEDDKAK